MLVILAITLVGCELLDPNGWKEAKESMRNKGTECYETRSGYVYCEDTK